MRAAKTALAEGDPGSPATAVATNLTEFALSGMRGRTTML